MAPGRSRTPLLMLQLLLLAVCRPACSMPANNVLDDQSLFSKLQTCFTASGMAELDAPLEQLAEKMPSVSRRRDILQAFLDCCSKQDFPAIEALEAKKQKANDDDLPVQLKTLQKKIQAIYKKYLMGSSVGLSMHGS